VPVLRGGALGLQPPGTARELSRPGRILNPVRSDHEPRATRSPLLRAALVGAGTLFVGLGIIGIVLPVMPTTPFLLVAAACYMRSSARLHGWLMHHPSLGPYVRGFAKGGAMPAQVKRNAIRTLWIAIAISITAVVLRDGALVVRLAIAGGLLVIAALVTVFIVSRPSVPDV
jgi:uncharacterized protein